MSNLDNRGLNFCTTSGLLTATGAETVYDTTVTIVYSINGKLSTKTAVTDGVTPTSDVLQGKEFSTLTANQACIMLWGLVSGGTVRCIQGPVVDWDGTNANPMPQFPSFPDTFVPFAYQFLKAGSTAGTITFGSSNWNATGFTSTIVNVAVLPEHPQIS